jgi:hypothetical protein
MFKELRNRSKETIRPAYVAWRAGTSKRVVVLARKGFQIQAVPRRLIYTALQWISQRPRSQNISKEQTLNPEKDSKRKRPRSLVSSEKSSKNYKPLEYWAKPNLLPDVTPHPENSYGDCILRVCHLVKPEPGEFLAILSSQINWPRRGERAGWIAVWSSSLTGW